MKPISIIAALTDDFAIGKNNDLLCHVPGDLKRFKKLTSGLDVVMGAKTYASLPVKPLPDRRNIVLTTRSASHFPGCLVVHSVEQALKLMSEDTETFIMGGGTIYRQFLPYASKLYLTFIHRHIADADTFFPAINFDEWREVKRETYCNTHVSVPHSFVVYQRRGC